MNTDDIDLYLKIQQRIRLHRRTVVFGVLAMLGAAVSGAGVLERTGDQFILENLFWIGTVIGGCVGALVMAALFGWGQDTVYELMEVVKRQIDRDPDAMQYYRLKKTT